MEIDLSLGLEARHIPALTPDLRQAIALLGMGAEDLCSALRDLAQHNPFLHVRAPPPAPPREPEAQRPSLIGHVLSQIPLCGLTRAESRLALLLAEALAPSGWLRETPEAIAEAHDLAPGVLCRVLEKLQRMEPTGLFARGLAECLRLQLEEHGPPDADAFGLLGHLDALTEGGPGLLARRSGMPRPRVEAALARLRLLDPQPGLAFSAAPAQIVVPDLLLRRGAAGWMLALNRSALPTVSVDGDLLRQIGGADKELRAAFGTARWIRAAVAHRHRTVLRIGTELVRRQGACFEGGPALLQPLSQRDLARGIGLSESTISRVVNAVWMQTPAGTIPLKRLFTTAIGPAEAELSPPRLMAEIRAMLRTEPAAAPLTDAQIAARLAAAGYSVARRTVAKYRVRAGIPGATERRRGAGGGTGLA